MAHHAMAPPARVMSSLPASLWPVPHGGAPAEAACPAGVPRASAEPGPRPAARPASHRCSAREAFNLQPPAGAAGTGGTGSGQAILVRHSWTPCTTGSPRSNDSAGTISALESTGRQRRRAVRGGRGLRHHRSRHHPAREACPMSTLRVADDDAPVSGRRFATGRVPWPGGPLPGGCSRRAWRRCSWCASAQCSRTL